MLQCGEAAKTTACTESLFASLHSAGSVSSGTNSGSLADAGEWGVVALSHAMERARSPTAILQALRAPAAEEVQVAALEAQQLDHEARRRIEARRSKQGEPLGHAELQGEGMQPQQPNLAGSRARTEGQQPQPRAGVLPGSAAEARGSISSKQPQQHPRAQQEHSCGMGASAGTNPESTSTPTSTPASTHEEPSCVPSHSTSHGPRSPSSGTARTLLCALASGANQAAQEFDDRMLHPPEAHYSPQQSSKSPLQHTAAADGGAADPSAQPPHTPTPTNYGSPLPQPYPAAQPSHSAHTNPHTSTCDPPSPHPHPPPTPTQALAQSTAEQQEQAARNSIAAAESAAASAAAAHPVRRLQGAIADRAVWLGERLGGAAAKAVQALRGKGGAPVPLQRVQSAQQHARAVQPQAHVAHAFYRRRPAVSSDQQQQTAATKAAEHAVQPARRQAQAHHAFYRRRPAMSSGQQQQQQEQNSDRRLSEQAVMHSEQQQQQQQQQNPTAAEAVEHAVQAVQHPGAAVAEALGVAELPVEAGQVVQQERGERAAEAGGGKQGGSSSSSSSKSNSSSSSSSGGGGGGGGGESVQAVQQEGEEGGVGEEGGCASGSGSAVCEAGEGEGGGEECVRVAEEVAQESVAGDMAQEGAVPGLFAAMQRAVAVGAVENGA